MTKPDDFSRIRLLNAGVAELPVDVNGQPPSPSYASFLKLSELNRVRSLAGYFGGVWLGRTLQLTSLGEIRSFWALEANPKIVDLRENYPFVSPEVIDDLAAGKEVARNRVWTLDFVATLAPSTPHGLLRYAGLSRKPFSLTESVAARRRARKEADACASLGWSWFQVDVPSKLCCDNLMNLRSWARAASIDSGADEARTLATALYKCSSSKPLRSLLPMLCKRTGIDGTRSYFFLGCAYYLGYIALDHRCPVHEDAVLPLVPLEP